jgi:signal transduction histidine kinase
MSSEPRSPFFKRLPPGGWTVLAWVAATGYSLLAQPADGEMAISLPPRPEFPNGYQHTFSVPGPKWMFLITAAVLTLTGSALLRRAPRSALELLLAGSVVGSIGLHSPPIGFLPAFLPVAVALYLVGARQSRRTSVAALILILVTVIGYLATTRLLTLHGPFNMFGLAQLGQAAPDDFSMEFAVTVTGVVAWLVGASSRQAQKYAENLGAQAATAERLRISRELHDDVAHSIGIIAVLAGAAGRVIETQPKAAREALISIEMTSRDTLTGLQRMLSALRQAEPGADRDAAPLARAPGLTDLGQLAAHAAGAGVLVDVTWRGERRLLPPEIDLSAFRIIQEAVTNVVRHSGTHACRVDVGFEPEELAIEIVDDGRGPAHAGRIGEAGFGLIGMRERVVMLSGQFSAGPRPEGGFRVAARLPA